MIVAEVLALRPFVPARDYAASTRFYEALGFAAAHKDEHVVVFEADGFGFILQNFFNEVLARNLMLQLLVDDADAAWARLRPETLVEEFALKPPIPPGMQHWGMKVGFIFDPGGVLWHVAERPR